MSNSIVGNSFTSARNTKLNNQSVSQDLNQSFKHKVNYNKLISQSLQHCEVELSLLV